jgi:serine/threonine protein kinase/Tol biopolymer transport system component
LSRANYNGAPVTVKSFLNHACDCWDPVIAGTKIGCFEILAPLGVGGMGEVYRARDTKLDREVAIKVLPEAVAQDPERLARFEREAKMLAALNHPNIAHIYGVEDGALVMELVDGEEPKGPLEWDDAWKIASQIADALEYAHERGIIHRDLKPTNIKVTPEGTVKLLDFGLAKATEDRPASIADPSNSPTFTLGGTTAGMIMGTGAYMAPEQASGKAVDRRSDIWSFGAVLFELLSGKRAFHGESATETLAMVLKVDPDWSALPVRTPVAARILLECCLKKERSERLQAIGDARLVLYVGRGNSGPVAPMSTNWKAWTVAALAIVLAIVSTWGWLRPRPQAPAAPSFSLTIVPPKGTDLPSVGSPRAAPLLSPDSAYVLTNDLLRNLNSLQMEPLRSMAGLSGEPFWSADSKWVAFPVADQLRKVRVPDGAPEVVVQHLGFSRGGTWNQDGTILIAAPAAQRVVGLYLLPAGGSLSRVEVPGLKDGNYYEPEFLPDSLDFLFAFRSGGVEDTEIFLATLRNGKIMNPVRLMQNPTAAHYTPAGGGRILFVRNDNLYSQRLNLKERKLEGDAEVIQQRLASAPGLASAEFSVSRSGLVAWRPGTQALSQVKVFDRQGKQVGTFGPPNDFTYLRLSPDETHLLAMALESGSQLLERDQPGMLRLGLGQEERWVWSPDGSHVVGRQDSKIVERSLSGPGETRILADAPGITSLEDISPDGKIALYSSLSSGKSVFSVRLDGTQGNRPISVVDTGEQILNERFSPDGRWIVYSARTMEGDRPAIFVQPFPGPGLRRQISSTGAFPVWRKDGKEILYMDRKSDQISAISVNGQPGDLRFGPPEALFAIPPSVSLLAASSPIEVMRDGSRILFPQALDQPEDSNLIHIRSGWLETQH